MVGIVCPAVLAVLVGGAPTRVLAAATSTPGPITFVDATTSSGLAPFVARTTDRTYAHAAAWGDVDGDGALDLFVGAFTSNSPASYQGTPAPSRLFLNDGDGTFTRAPEPNAATVRGGPRAPSSWTSTATATRTSSWPTTTPRRPV